MIGIIIIFIACYRVAFTGFSPTEGQGFAMILAALLEALLEVIIIRVIVVYKDKQREERERQERRQRR